MASIRIINLDYYMSSPISDLDVVYSEFRGLEVRQVPVIQVFGSTNTGEKTCLNVHGVFPYIYIPYDGKELAGPLCYKVASELDKSINISLGQAASNANHIHNIVLVSGTPFYGYHEKPHQFLKIYFYNPAIIKKACSLLENGTILGKIFQPHEAHINYILQFCIDYNLHGMSFINVAHVKYRNDQNTPEVFKDIPRHLILPLTVQKRTVCYFEMDTLASDIINIEEIRSGKFTTNPGIAALWDDEKQRRRNQQKDSQISFCLTQERDNDIVPTISHQLYSKKLDDKLSKDQYDDIENESSAELDRSVYPAETPDNDPIVLAMNSSALDTTLTDEILTHENQSLSQNDQNLLKILQELKETVHVEEDSILSQHIQDQIEFAPRSDDENSEDEQNNLSYSLNQTQVFSENNKNAEDDDSIWENSFWDENCQIPQLDGIYDIGKYIFPDSNYETESIISLNSNCSFISNHNKYRYANEVFFKCNNNMSPESQLYDGKNYLIMSARSETPHLNSRIKVLQDFCIQADSNLKINWKFHDSRIKLVVNQNNTLDTTFNEESELENFSDVLLNDVNLRTITPISTRNICFDSSPNSRINNSLLNDEVDCINSIDDMADTENLLFNDKSASRAPKTYSFLRSRKIKKCKISSDCSPQDCETENLNKQELNNNIFISPYELCPYESDATLLSNLEFEMMSIDDTLNILKLPNSDSSDKTFQFFNDTPKIPNLDGPADSSTTDSTSSIFSGNGKRKSKKVKLDIIKNLNKKIRKKSDANFKAYKKIHKETLSNKKSISGNEKCDLNESVKMTRKRGRPRKSTNVNLSNKPSDSAKEQNSPKKNLPLKDELINLKLNDSQKIEMVINNIKEDNNHSIRLDKSKNIDSPIKPSLKKTTPVKHNQIEQLQPQEKRKRKSTKKISLALRKTNITKDIIKELRVNLIRLDLNQINNLLQPTKQIELSKTLQNDEKSSNTSNSTLETNIISKIEPLDDSINTSPEVRHLESEILVANEENLKSEKLVVNEENLKTEKLDINEETLTSPKEKMCLRKSIEASANFVNLSEKSNKTVLHKRRLSSRFDSLKLIKQQKEMFSQSNSSLVILQTKEMPDRKTRKSNFNSPKNERSPVKKNQNQNKTILLRSSSDSFVDKLVTSNKEVLVRETRNSKIVVQTKASNDILEIADKNLDTCLTSKGKKSIKQSEIIKTTLDQDAVSESKNTQLEKIVNKKPIFTKVSPVKMKSDQKETDVLLKFNSDSFIDETNKSKVDVPIETTRNSEIYLSSQEIKSSNNILKSEDNNLTANLSNKEKKSNKTTNLDNVFVSTPLTIKSSKCISSSSNSPNKIEKSATILEKTSQIKKPIYKSNILQTSLQSTMALNFQDSTLFRQTRSSSRLSDFSSHISQSSDSPHEIFEPSKMKTPTKKTANVKDSPSSKYSPLNIIRTSPRKSIVSPLNNNQEPFSKKLRNLQKDSVLSNAVVWQNRLRKRDGENSPGIGELQDLPILQDETCKEKNEDVSCDKINSPTSINSTFSSSYVDSIKRNIFSVNCDKKSVITDKNSAVRVNSNNWKQKEEKFLDTIDNLCAIKSNFSGKSNVIQNSENNRDSVTQFLEETFKTPEKKSEQVVKTSIISPGDYIDFSPSALFNSPSKTEYYQNFVFAPRETLSQKYENENSDLYYMNTKTHNLTREELYDISRGFAPQPGTSNEEPDYYPFQNASQTNSKSSEKQDNIISQSSSESSQVRNNISQSNFESSQLQNNVISQLSSESFFCCSQRSTSCDINNVTSFSCTQPFSQTLPVLDESFTSVTETNSRIWMPKFNAPTPEMIRSTLVDCNIPENRFQDPFYSNYCDVTKKIDIGHNVLKIPGKTVADLEEFMPSIEFEGIEKWRKNKFEASFSDCGPVKNNLRVTLAGHSSFIISPVEKPPSREDVIKWIESKTQKSNLNETTVKTQKLKISIPCSPGGDDYDSCNESITLSPFSPNVLTPVIKSNTSFESTPKMVDDSPSLLRKRKSNRKGTLQKKALFSQNLQNVNLNVSNSGSNDSCRISGVTLDNTHGFKLSYENLQNAKALNEHQYLTILVLELHVGTRNDLNPDPQYDSIQALFYSIANDVPNNYILPKSETGIIVVNNLSSPTKRSSRPILEGIGVDNSKITYVNSELQLVEFFVNNIIKKWDPDIFTGFEIEMLSWGYLIERCYVLNINLPAKISRTNPAILRSKSLENFEPSQELKFHGRIILDAWRLFRHEIALTSYTFENLMFHILHQRVPTYSFKNLTFWWNHRSNRYRRITVQHYIIRVEGILKLMDQLDLIGRTSELARLFGIQFYEVLSRGSQFRVESMMLRLAKPLNFIPVSPSVQQRAKMRSPEWIPLIFEPQSRFYSDPVVVLDFQSLYPSIIIAYNYCFSTCIGRVDKLGTNQVFEFGATQLKVTRKNLKRLKNKLVFSPCGVGFVTPSVRLGILPRMLKEILETRLMVKASMKQNKDNKILQRVLHSRQLGLKLIANVTYGYTAANFSGRMPCSEVGDSVVSKGRETLERAIKLIESNEKWRARVVYGDTDSLFVLLQGRNRNDAFKIGEEIATAVTNDNPVPVKLKLEKVYQPCILQTKKRYVGYMYEAADQKEPTYDAKGIETVRRDGCLAVAKILEKSLRTLFETRDVSLVKRYICRQFEKILTGRASVQDLIFAREYRGAEGYRPGACVPALELSKRWTAVDRRKEPRRGERVPYIIVHGPPGVPLIRLVRCPRDLIGAEQQVMAFRPNAEYYITRVIAPALNRCLHLIGADVLTWYNDMPRKQLHTLPTEIHFVKNKKSTISQYFATMNCAACNNQTKDGLCDSCFNKPQATITTLQEKINKWERTHENIKKICQSCCSRSEQIDCISLDCPVFYRFHQTHRDLKQVPFIRNLISKFNTNNSIFI